MRRLSGLLLAGAILLLPAFSQGHGNAFAQAAPQKFILDGEAAVWTVGIKAGKGADYEKIMAKLKEGLSKSDKPEKKQQAMGWKLVKMNTPQPDGTVVYVHVINPVVAGADYGVMAVLYQLFPTESQQLYDLYRGAFDKNMGLIPGSIVLDMAK